MVARSPSLEFLLIIRCTGARRLRTNSFTLRTIAVDNHSPDPSIEELVIESAPHLQTLIHLDHNHDLHIATLSVPKLETLGCTNSMRLVLGSTDIRHHQVADLLLHFFYCRQPSNNLHFTAYIQKLRMLLSNVLDFML
uniref:F-box/LRR-repeat protein 15/At3g58940/PEG3-like LRR domain-containing protein n=1 Tax=Hordeum vulgare subsp. vulgare TaxID=112509 RepID=A0A8I6Y5S2_HORVV